MEDIFARTCSNCGRRDWSRLLMQALRRSRVAGGLPSLAKRYELDPFAGMTGC